MYHIFSETPYIQLFCVHCSHFTMNTKSKRPIRRFLVREALGIFFQPDEEWIEVEPDIEEDVSEIEDNIDPDHCETDQSTDGKEEAPEEDTSGEETPEEEAPEVTFQSKDGNLLWC